MKQFSQSEIIHYALDVLTPCIFPKCGKFYCITCSNGKLCLYCPLFIIVVVVNFLDSIMKTGEKNHNIYKAIYKFNEIPISFSMENFM